MREHWLVPSSPYPSYQAYLEAVGGSAVEAARRRSSADLLDQIKKSGLRGRGGAGFPTGTKWATIVNHPCRIHDAVVNAAEGEPGTFKDRWLLRHNPYAVLEGLLIGGHVIGARGLYIGIKATSTAEIARLNTAIAEMSKAGHLGGKEIHVTQGPEEYLFGEEKALLEVIEGNEPLPREAHYPPYEKGLFATSLSPNPALVNNAETFAHVPGIVLHGAESFRRLGTANTPGTCHLHAQRRRRAAGRLRAGSRHHAARADLRGGRRPARRTADQGHPVRRLGSGDHAQPARHPGRLRFDGARRLRPGLGRLHGVRRHPQHAAAGAGGRAVPLRRVVQPVRGVQARAAHGERGARWTLPRADAPRSTTICARCTALAARRRPTAATCRCKGPS